MDSPWYFVARVTLGNGVGVLWTVDSMQAMTDPKELDALCPGESKRQREALRRKLDRGGHTCGIGLSTIGGQNVELSHNELNMTRCRPPARTSGEVHQCQDQR